MKSLLASVRDGGGLDRVDHAVQLLEDEWRRHGDVPLERLWKEQKHLLGSDAGESVVLLSEMIKADLRCRFARGQTPAVADYLARFPELNEADSRVLSLIYEEFCLVEERDDRVDVAAFCDRYPRWKDSLASQLRYHHLLSQAAGIRPKPPPFPEAGDTFEEFHLTSLLGRGGTSRVFLARDLSLGGKQVVLKVSLDRGREPQAQGALDHPHIVPVNSVTFGENGMRGLSMPYRPGLPLDEVIRRVAPASRPRRAMALWEALVRPPEPTTDPASSSEAAPPVDLRAHGPRGDGWEGFPIRGTYSQGVAWVVKIIASALHYAHGQRTFHRDVKPANVLLTIQHGPQLLDFNLAESPHSASQAQAAMQGGTLPYMAPEQIEAFLNPDLWGKVGAQADLYALGLVLRELLTGQAPDLPAETLAPARAMRVLLDRRPLLDVTVRRANPAIPHALEAIVAKCLAIAPEDRYPDAGALVEDLDRFLNHQPLVHVTNPSRRERCANWAERNRSWVAAAGLAAVCLVALPSLLPRIVARPPIAGRTPIAIRPRPPIRIEESPDLRAALRCLDQGEVQASIQPLSSLAEQYPESSIPRIYLTLAHDVLDEDEDAESRFREVLAMPHAKDELASWVPRDRRLPERLARFVDNRIRKAGKIQRNEALAESDRQKGRTEQFRMAKFASEIALRLQPDSDVHARSLAFCEASLGELDSSRRRAEQAIGAITAELEATADLAARNQFDRMLFQWRTIKCLALTKLADRLRSEGSTGARETALAHLDLVEKELEACSRFAHRLNYGQVEKHEVEEGRVPALLSRVEIEIDLGRLRAASEDWDRARNALSYYDALSRSVGRPSEFASFSRRIHAIGRRLRQEQEKRIGSDPDRPTRVTANASSGQ